MSTTNVIEKGRQNNAGVRRLGELPPRKTLQALFQDIDQGFSAERSLKIIAGASIVLAVIAVGVVLHAARPIMLPLTAAFVISLLLAPVADWFGRRGVPEQLRAAIVVFAAMAALTSAFYFLGKPAMQWSEHLPHVVAEARHKLHGVQNAVDKVKEASQQVEKMTDMASGSAASAVKTQSVVVKDRTFSDALASTARTALIEIVFTAVLIYFLLATRSSFRTKALAARPTLTGKLQTARLLRDIQQKVGSYMFTMLMINIGLGTVVSLGMIAIGMPTPYVWGLLAGVLNFVPYLGPAALTALLAVSGVVNYDSLLMMAAPAMIYVVANFIESNFVTPSLVGIRLRISPLAIIVSIALLTWIWGPVGAVIAIPLVVVFKTICDAVPFMQPIGVLIGEVEIVKGRKVGFCRISTIPEHLQPAAKHRRHARAETV